MRKTVAAKTAESPLLEIRNLSFEEQNHSVLSDISFAQNAFQQLVIVGETGSGKSTLLQIIAGLVQPGSGEVFFGGKRVKGPQEVLVPGQPGIAYLSQHFELPQFLRVEQVLEYANTLAGNGAETLFEICRIGHLLKRKTSELSGGERQRIALAKLLLSSPKLLLLDEPFSNLDAGHKKVLKTVLQEIGEALNITTLLVSHDPLDTLSWADEILVLQQGKITQRGTPEQVYRQPLNEYAASLFGSYNLIPAAKSKFLTALLGLPPQNKALLVRPEALTFTDQPEKAFRGKIKHIRFFGSFYEVEVQISDLKLIVKTLRFSGKKDEEVFIKLKPAEVWFL